MGVDPLADAAPSGTALGVFLPHDVLDSWIVSKRLELSKDIMTFRWLPLSLRLVPAYYFERVTRGSDERNQLLGRVKSKAALAALGAEVYRISVILGETEYEAEDGFILKPVEPTCTRQALLRAVAGC
jgi:hypothetical protein